MKIPRLPSHWFRTAIRELLLGSFLLSLIIFGFSVYQDSPPIRAEVQRICTANTRTPGDYSRCFAPYLAQSTTLHFGAVIFIIVFTLTGAVWLLLRLPPKIRLAAIALFIFLPSLSLILAGAFVYRQAKIFTNHAKVPLSTVVGELKKGLREPPASGNTVTFLILGTNRIPSRSFVSEITDTMMLASVNLKTGRIGLFSIPRDIWSVPYETKIDAFYVYGADKYPGQPERFPTEVVQEITGVPVNYTIVIRPEVFAQIIDTFGGVWVDVTHPFIDYQFPNPNVDVRVVTDPKLLYLTVEFKKGLQLMSGQRALEYVRSRHAEGSQGSDIARSQRQREVIMSLAGRLQNPAFYTNVARLGDLYRLYRQDFARYLPLDRLIALARTLYPLRHQLNFTQGSPSIYPDNPSGSIYHPDFSPLGDGQWVYLIRNQGQFQREVKQALGL